MLGFFKKIIKKIRDNSVDEIFHHFLIAPKSLSLCSFLKKILKKIQRIVINKY
jgi:hypothetical protein